MKEDKNYEKKKIELKSTKRMRYYPVIVANASDQQQPTIINVNVGGQTFRMYDQTLIGGVLV